MGVVALLDKDDEGLVECFDKNIKYEFDVHFILTHPLEYLLEETLGMKCIFLHVYMKKGWLV